MRKHIAFALTTTLITCSTFIYGDTEEDMEDSKEEIQTLKYRVSALEERKSCRQCFPPAVRPDVCDGWDLFINADALFWTAEEDGLEFAEEHVQSTNPITSLVSLTQGKILNPNFDWNWGFRIGMGYNLPHDGWDLYLNWVRFNNHGHKSVSVLPSQSPFGDGPILYASTGSGTRTGPASLVQEAAVHWNLKLNLLDLEVGREFFISKWLTLRPFAGLRSAWIHQKMSDDYVQQNSLGTPIFAYDINQKCNFWGLGVRAGLNTLWGLGWGLAIYADGAISLLPGQFHVDFNQSNEDLTQRTTTLQNSEDNLTVARAATDLALGIRWDKTTCDEAYHFVIRLGFEQHYFFGQNQFRNYNFATTQRVISRASIGDLNTYGITGGIEIGF